MPLQTGKGNNTAMAARPLDISWALYGGDETDDPPDGDVTQYGQKRSCKRIVTPSIVAQASGDSPMPETARKNEIPGDIPSREAENTIEFLPFIHGLASGREA
jgi:hypothetical protein